MLRRSEHHLGWVHAYRETWIFDQLAQSFANISQATADQLQNLPGFGQVKVKNIKNAFEKPFRNQATSSLSQSRSQGKRPATQQSTSQQDQQLPPPVSQRAESPAWDIEYEEGQLPDEEEQIEPTGRKSPPHTEVFDIDLDLN